MRLCFKKNEERAWEVELDELSLVTWEIYSNHEQAKSDYRNLSEELTAAMRNRYTNPSSVPEPFVYSSFSMERKSYGEPTTVTLRRQFNEQSEAKAELDRLIQQKLDEGYTKSTEVLGTKERRDLLSGEIASNKKRTSNELPACFEKLDRDKVIDFNGPLSSAVKRVFGIPLAVNESDGPFNPIQGISYLGKGSTQLYWQCQNTPMHHLQNASSWDDGPDGWFESVGVYYGFDFDAIDLNGRKLSLRAIINGGDADCNDGLWGEVWNRETGERLANIMSTGDCESTIEAVSHADLFQSQDLPILYTMALNDDRDEESESDPERSEIWNRGFYFSAVRMRCANDLKLERIIALAIKIFGAHVNEAYHQN